MTAPYKEFRYLTPPRAEAKVPPELLSFMEQKGYYAQVKKNGTNTVLFLGPKGFVRAMNRHGGDISRWTPSAETVHFLRAQLPGGWNVLNGELLHHKTKTVKGVLYLHDVLVYGSDYLTGYTYAQRHSLLLNSLARDSDRTWSHYILPGGIWVARNLRKGFSKVFHKLSSEEDEGLILKRPTGILSSGRVDWAFKCRRPHKNYAY